MTRVLRGKAIQQCMVELGLSLHVTMLKFKLQINDSDVKSDNRSRRVVGVASRRTSPWSRNHPLSERLSICEMKIGLP